MADDDSNDTGLMKEFEEFLTQKRANEKEQEESDDFDVEIWDEKGRGVRTKRSHAKPFLQSLGIDLDPEEKESEGKTTAKRKPTPSKSQSITKKYFSNKG